MYCRMCGGTTESCGCNRVTITAENIIEEQREIIEQLESELSAAKEEIDRLRMQLNR